MDISGIAERYIEERGFKFHVYFKSCEQEEGYILCHHGIGSSALTFALFLRILAKLNPKLGIIAYDARYHGSTECLGNQTTLDLDLNSLELDLDALLRVLLPPQVGQTSSLLLLGHSMGGTLVSKYSLNKNKPQYFDVRGLVVVDAVEGYARKSLSIMNSLLLRWPQQFRSSEEAIKWHLSGGNLLRNKESAEISVPPLFKMSKSGFLEWKLDLKQTEHNWDSWFDGLDEWFCGAPTARLLVLAGVGKLDTSLTRAQMQGKFQLIIVNEAGHYIQEDAPTKLAHAINDFWDRNGKPLQIIPKFGSLRSNP